MIKNSFRDIDLSITTIEHGLYIGNLVPERHIQEPFSKIITFSDYRKRIIQTKTDKEVITVGPYIKYANPLYSSEKIINEKNRLGKTLLVFPSHSIDSVYAKYNIKQFVDYIKVFQKKYQFNTVLVCLYWKDIALGLHEEYISAGYRVLSAGHSFDPNFLNRLKTIIYLSDATLTNTVGTHVGYAVNMNKPTKIWTESEVEYHANPGYEVEAAKELTQRQGQELETYLNAIEHIKKAFVHFDDKLLDEQRECIKYYWGD